MSEGYHFAHFDGLNHILPESGQLRTLRAVTFCRGMRLPDDRDELRSADVPRTCRNLGLHLVICVNGDTRDAFQRISDVRSRKLYHTYLIGETTFLMPELFFVS